MSIWSRPLSPEDAGWVYPDETCLFCGLELAPTRTPEHPWVHAGTGRGACEYPNPEHPHRQATVAHPKGSP